eukprot:gene16119-22262_t
MQLQEEHERLQEWQERLQEKCKELLEEQEKLHVDQETLQEKCKKYTSNMQEAHQQHQQAGHVPSPAIVQQAGHVPSPAIVQQAGHVPSPDIANPSPAGIVNKKQRRLALACVALRLAGGGVSMKQAINSSVMGGMSVSDVQFIEECYNAEHLRMRNANGGSEDAHVHVRGLEVASAEDAINSIKLQQDRLECARGPSPATSFTRSDTSPRTSESIATAAAQATDMVTAAAQATDDMATAAQATGKVINSLPQEVAGANFNALSYGFSGQANNFVGGALREDADVSLGVQQVQQQHLLQQKQQQKELLQQAQ